MKTLVLLGPTAVGKSKLAVELAKAINGEIISADSMQVYRGMDIGTAKPTLEERQGIPHHLIDVRNPDEDWTVSDFVTQTNHLTTDQPNHRSTQYIIVGGTGLYLWTLLEGYSFPIAPADKSVRERLENIPGPTLYARLSTIDPAAAAKIHPNDKKRIVRALEVYELTGQPISRLQQKRVEEALPAGRQGFRPPLNGDLKIAATNAKLIGLTLPREELYTRINQRVDKMIEKGLIDEVKSLLAKGYSKELNSLQALGYKEVIDYLDGTWGKEEMINELKKRTRNFARRQMTWFKRFKDVAWFGAPFDFAAIFDYIKSHG